MDTLNKMQAEAAVKLHALSVDPGSGAQGGIASSNQITLKLEQRQIVLIKKLAVKNSNLANIYYGALWALQQEENPDRLALAAHDFRELMEKFPLYVNIGIRPSVSMGSKVNELKTLWTRLINSHRWQDKLWEGLIDVNIAELLRFLDSFFEWHEKEVPSKTDKVIQVFRELDPTKRKIPYSLEKLNAQFWRTMNEYFQGVSHHGNTNTSYDEFCEYVYSLEQFLIERIERRTFDDHSEIDSIINKE